MFGMGGSEIIVILIVALLFLGPDKLPQAAKSISKGIRDIKKQSRALQQQIESDEQIGGAIRDLKSALRGEDLPPDRPRLPRKPASLTEGMAAAGADAGEAAVESAALGAAAIAAGDGTAIAGSHARAGADTAGEAEGRAAGDADAGAPPRAAAAPAEPKLTLPRTAGEAGDLDGAAPADDGDLAAMIKPAPGTVAKGT